MMTTTIRLNFYNKKINNEYFYNIGNIGYIKAANIGQIDNKPLCMVKD